VLAEKSQEKLSPTDPDRSFYEGKKWSALLYARNVLPNVEHEARLISQEDSSPMGIPDAAFASSL
jgi:hypothetical protein